MKDGDLDKVQGGGKFFDEADALMGAGKGNSGDPNDPKKVTAGSAPNGI